MSTASLLEAALPRWQRRERHVLVVAAPPERLLRAAEELTWSEVPVFRALMWLRFRSRTRLADEDAVLDVFDHLGGFRRQRNATELVVSGAIPVSRRDGKSLLVEPTTDLGSVETPGHLLVAFNFRCDTGNLRTETRAYGTDRRTRRAFALYWLAIRPWSGLIRQIWLRAIRRRAERSEPTQSSP